MVAGGGKGEEWEWKGRGDVEWKGGGVEWKGGDVEWKVEERKIVKLVCRTLN